MKEHRRRVPSARRGTQLLVVFLIGMAVVALAVALGAWNSPRHQSAPAPCRTCDRPPLNIARQVGRAYGGPK